MRSNGVNKETLQTKYNAWRKEGIEEVENTGLNFSWDCGEAAAREDFSYSLGLEKITYEEMEELEKNFE